MTTNELTNYLNQPSLIDGDFSSKTPLENLIGNTRHNSSGRRFHPKEILLKSDEDIRRIRLRRQQERLDRKRKEQLRKQNWKLETDISNLKLKELPHWIYHRNKRKQLCHYTSKSLSNIEEELSNLTSNHDRMESQEREDLKQLELSLQSKINCLKNDHDMFYRQAEYDWSERLREYQNMRPSEELEKDIKSLQGELLNCTKLLDELMATNEQKTRNYELELKAHLESFQYEKSQELEEVLVEQAALTAEKSSLTKNRTDIITKIEQLDENKNQYTKNILLCEQELMSVEKVLEPLRIQSTVLYEQLINADNALLNQKQENASISNSLLEAQTSISLERKRTNRLKETIIDMKGNARCLGYIRTYEIPNKYQVQYNKNQIITTDGLDAYKFTKLISCEKVPELELLEKHFKYFLDHRLKGNENSTLLSISTKANTTLRFALTKLISNNYLKDYMITLQFVYLSDGTSKSEDMILYSQIIGHAVPVTGINIKLGLNSVMLDSQLITMENEYESLMQNAIQKEDELHSRIGLLKFQFFDKVKMPDKPIELYFVELHNSKGISISERVMKTTSVMKTHVDYVLRKLINETKLFTILHMDHEDTTDKFLALSRNVMSISQAKAKKKMQT